MKPHDTARTYVLIHGAWHGGWCWREVAAILRADGHRVETPTLIGVGERSHLLSREIDLELMIRDLVDQVAWENLPDITLVGHSFGGAVITGLADRIGERLSRLVYLDAAWLADGQSIFDTLPPALVADRISAAEAFDGGLSLPVPPPESFGIVDEPHRQELIKRLTPHPLAGYSGKLSIAGPPTNGLPACYVICTAPLYQPLAAARQAAHAAGLSILELAAPHDAMISHPLETAEMLLRRVR